MGHGRGRGRAGAPGAEVSDWLELAVPMSVLRDELKRQGLHVVTAQQMAVLEACKAARIDKNDCSRFVFASEEHAVCEAELARRATERQTTEDT